MKNPSKIADSIAFIIFSSRWLQMPLFVGLIVAQVVYVVQFMMELKHLVFDLFHLSEAEIMLIILGLIDIVMVANLLIMVIIGGYETFVSRLYKEEHPDYPEWLSHVNATTMETLIIQVSIHFAFVVTTIALAFTDRLMAETTRH